VKTTPIVKNTMLSQPKALAVEFLDLRKK